MTPSILILDLSLSSEDNLKHAYVLPYPFMRGQWVVKRGWTKKGKAPSKSDIRQFIEEDLTPLVQKHGIKYILVNEGSYFKTLTGNVKVEPYLGFVCDSLWEGAYIVYVPSPRALLRDPDTVRPKIDQAMTGLESHISGSYVTPGTDLIQHAEYPSTYTEIQSFLEKVTTFPKLTIDIETFSLKHTTAGIGSITFCWNEHEGGAFVVDNLSTKEKDYTIRSLLKNFFMGYEGTIIFHNIAFDGYVLVYQLFMRDLLDTEGLLQGLRVIFKNWDDTKLITYLATNSTARCELGLKALAQEFAGNWALGDDIKDITKVEPEKLLRYNLIDGLSTWFVYNRYYPRMIEDNQLHIYETLFKDATLDIVQMQLTGLPVNMEKVKEFSESLEKDRQDALVRMNNNSLMKDFILYLNKEWVKNKNAVLKKKRVTLEDAKEEFNPGSTKQLQQLLYDFLSFPKKEFTESGQVSVSNSTLVKCLESTRGTTRELLQAIIDYSEVNKIISTFVPILENAVEGPDGWHYIFGSFNLGGTVSGRLSSSNP